ncbi:MAG: hypothetical protein JWP29_1128 [Rhodoferax sp.]|nr:hypothetical protein [Rhodoferax sp.]
MAPPPAGHRFRPGRKAGIAIAIAVVLAGLVAAAASLGGCAALGAKPDGERLARIQ